MTLLSAFRDLRIRCHPVSEKQTLEQFSSLQGYYLIDPVYGRKAGDQTQALDNAVKEYFTDIFCGELSEKGIPVEEWPDVDDYDVFKAFIKVDALALTADFGATPLKTEKSYV